MIQEPPLPGGRAFAALRRLKRSEIRDERCDLCSIALGPGHKHFVEFASERLLCACDLCAILLDASDGKYRRVGSAIRRLPGFRIADGEWRALGVPVNLAFFYKPRNRPGAVAVFPSPAGSVRSEVDTRVWEAVENGNQLLRTMAPLVEAVLIHRGDRAENDFLVPIDKCYRLIGTVRRYWRGFYGGPEVQEKIAEFFEDLLQQAI